MDSTVSPLAMFQVRQDLNLVCLGLTASAVTAIISGTPLLAPKEFLVIVPSPPAEHSWDLEKTGRNFSRTTRKGSSLSGWEPLFLGLMTIYTLSQHHLGSLPQ